MGPKVLAYQVSKGSEQEPPKDDVDRLTITTGETVSRFIEDSGYRLSIPVILGQGTAKNSACVSCHSNDMGIQEGEVIGVFSILYNTTTIFAALQNFKIKIMILLLSSLFIVSGLLILLIKYFVGKPISNIAASMVAVAEGNQDVKIPGNSASREINEIIAATKVFKKYAASKSEELEFEKYALDEHAIVSITDVKGDITYVNDKFCEISGYSNEELLGQNHRMVRSDEHLPAFYKDLWGTIASGKPWNGEIKNIKKGGGSYWVAATIVPFLNEAGKPFQYVAIRTDITSNKEAEVALEAANEETQRQVLELADNKNHIEQIASEQIALSEDLVIARDQADNANQAKSEFLSSMSHELRTPMNAILGFGQMLDFNPKEPLTEAQKGCVEHIMKGGQHLLSLINDILDLAQIEAGKVKLSIENISPTAVLYDCLPLISGMTEKRGINISIPDAATKTLWVRADHTRFKQVLLNFISNAVKYNRENGTISVNFEKTADNMLRINVTDSGDGISADKQKELFKPFSRLGAENTEIEGTGIGLVVCKELIEIMHGTVGLESEVGKGSTFWFKLPLAEHNQDEVVMQTQDAIERMEGKLPDIGGTLLYVEDNPANLQLMELIVEHIEGLSMISIHTGELGIKMALAEKPDVIILDINLPGISGIEVLKKLRGYDETKDIPILALSAAATESDIKKGIDAGFLQYLTKPIMAQDVVEAIKKALDTA